MINSNEWLYTTEGNARGYIQPQKLRELWFHTGTVCNLNCPFCLEGSGPNSMRLDAITFNDIKPYISEAIELGVEKFSFTGGEPFVNPSIIEILNYVLEYKPSLVLTNATEPLRNKFEDIKKLVSLPNPLDFRVSLDYPDPEKHDKNRGVGHFKMALETMKMLSDHGFKVSVARQAGKDENSTEIEDKYRSLFVEEKLPVDIKIISFPDLLPPDSHPSVPQITENCMITYKSEEEREVFMCNFSKMIIKVAGKTGVYACTLVDDDVGYNLGHTLKEAMKARVMLRHHRCFACFSSGTSCSEE